MTSGALAASATDDVARSASNIWAATVEALPRVGIAVLVVAFAWGVGRLTRAGLGRLLRRKHTPSFATVMAKIGGWLVVTIGVLLALAVTFPSVRPVDLLAGLGFFSVAVGFAFQDILENLLAGILLLLRQPFAGGDQVRVGEHEGTVERITIRETVITTFDGERTLIPNADVYKSAVRIQTAEPNRRSSFVVGVAYETDLDRARSIAVEALRSVEGIADDPPPEALLTELASSTVNIDMRYWSASAQRESRLVLDRAIAAVKSAFDRAGIEMPSELLALQATESFVAGIRGGAVTPGGAVRADQRSPDAPSA